MKKTDTARIALINTTKYICYKCLSYIFIIALLSACNISCLTKEQNDYDVIVLGEGTGATSAAIQAARSGAKTLLVNPISWLGGMMTSAGVSATDGNHQLHAGLWDEWRSYIRNHYGGIDSVFTGWVSNTMFEPSIGDLYWKQIAGKEPNLSISYDTNWGQIIYDDKWSVELEDRYVIAKVLVDGTDLGDVAAALGASFDLGMDARSKTNEDIAPEQANDILQDLTFASILKDYGGPGDHVLSKPDNYNPEQFRCACKTLCPEADHDCATMLSYGKLPNDKYMINWPIHGNDYYVNIVGLSFNERQLELKKAKNRTIEFIYFIQSELGYTNLGLADDEFPTSDRLPFMPYHREGRRIHGLSKLSLNEILNPFEHDLYKAGVAVGDYPVDHHHSDKPDLPMIEFPKVPSFSIPYGALVPKDIPYLIIADKAISVTNIANGSTRLQPVIIQVGQAAGLIAAQSVAQGTTPSELNIRQVQQQILDYKGYLMPYIDLGPDQANFEAVQRIGATGILKGRPVPFKWANQTWFDPDSTMLLNELLTGLIDFDQRFKQLRLDGDIVSGSDLTKIFIYACRLYQLDCPAFSIPLENKMKRVEIAKYIDEYIDPFVLKKLDHSGKYLL